MSSHRKTKHSHGCPILVNRARNAAEPHALSFALRPTIVRAGAIEEKPVRSIDEEIARHLQEMAESGELSRIDGFGKPMAEDSGWNATPEALRMPFKILKNSGFHPPEIEMFHE